MGEGQLVHQGARTAAAASKVSLAVFMSRILGLVRDQLLAKLFGAGFYSDAWLVAFRIPNLLRDLFAEGALSAAVVPTFTDVLRRQGRSAAWQLASLVLSGLMVVLGALAILVFVLSDYFVHGLAVGFADVPGKVEVTATLLRILCPFLLLIAMASVAMGVLNALDHYFIPALAPALFNVALILAAVLLVPWFERHGILPIYALGVGGVAGGILQFAVQVPLLVREGFRFSFRVHWNDEGIVRIRRLVGPALLGVSAVQINVLVNTQLASLLQDNGPVSWLSYAFRILYLPIGLFGVAVGVANLRDVSVFAAEKDIARLKETVAGSIKLISFLAVPSTVGLLVLGNPIVQVIFERGDFTARDTQFTAWALMAYSVGLFGFSCNKIYVPTFYALNDTRTPVRITLAAVASNLAVNLALIVLLPLEYGFVGLALGTSVSVAVSNSLLTLAFRKRWGGFGEFGLGDTIARNLAAAGAMGFVIWVLIPPAGSLRLWGGWSGEALSLSLLIGAGLITYLASSWMLRVRELQYLLQLVRPGR